MLILILINSIPCLPKHNKRGPEISREYRGQRQKAESRISKKSQARESKLNSQFAWERQAGHQAGHRSATDDHKQVKKQPVESSTKEIRQSGN